MNTILLGKHPEAGLGMDRSQRLVKGKHFEEREIEKGYPVPARNASWAIMPVVDKSTGARTPQVKQEGRKHV